MPRDVSHSLPQLEPRAADSHKGDFGHAMIIGGSRGMSGAVALSGMAALRSGAGLVTLLVPDPCLDVVASFEPAYMTVGLAADDRGRVDGIARNTLEHFLERATSVAIGPGLGRSAGLDELVRSLYETLSVPLVVDADGLNALASRPLPPAPAPRILTPHPGEFRRLCPDAPRDRTRLVARGIEWAQENNVILVLKGHQTLITDGERFAHNGTGNPGMATGGTGDVLTGIAVALAGQRLEAFEAAQLAVHVHGLAGDLAATELGEVSLISSDLLRFLGGAFMHHGGDEGRGGDAEKK